jgi:CubicO group peptidase (beta-lactamase class C family)
VNAAQGAAPGWANDLEEPQSYSSTAQSDRVFEPAASSSLATVAPFGTFGVRTALLDTDPDTRAMKTTRRSSILLSLVLLLVLPTAGWAQAPAPLEGLDAWIESEMRRWQIPGLAVAVVKDDSVVYARGFGVRRLGEAARVDEHTLFGVASTTKAMTAAALGMLVDEGRIGWDDPVVTHLPAFQLADPWVTRQVTIRDLLAHRVGVGRITGNRLRFLPNRTRAEVLHQMRHHWFEQPFRQGYVYSNAMYTVAGEIIPAVTGLSWDDFLRERIFRPLGMTRSNTRVAEIAEGANAAWPHQEIDGRVQPIPRRSWDVVAPSAAVNTSAREMAQWMRLQLGEPGVYRGERLLSERIMRDMHTPQVALGGNSLDGSAFAAYGLGWNLREYEGRWISQHGGATDGMNTNLVLVPSENLGVVVMTNTFNSLMNAITNRVVDAYLGLPDREWADLYWGAYQRQHAVVQARRDSIHAARIARTRTTAPLAEYAGTYVDSLYLDAAVRQERNRLVLQLWDDPEMTAELEHWHHDTFRAVWRNRSMREEWVWFTMGPDGRPDALHVQWSLRPLLLQVGAYPTDYYRVVRFGRVR